MLSQTKGTFFTFITAVSNEGNPALRAVSNEGKARLEAPASTARLVSSLALPGVNRGQSRGCRTASRERRPQPCLVDLAASCGLQLRSVASLARPQHALWKRVGLMLSLRGLSTLCRIWTPRVQLQHRIMCLWREACPGSVHFLDTVMPWLCFDANCGVECTRGLALSSGRQLISLITHHGPHWRSPDSRLRAWTSVPRTNFVCFVGSGHRNL